MLDPAKYAPGSHACHEAMHMAHFLATCVDTELCDHPAVGCNRHFTALANTARVALHDLYQAIAAVHLP